MNVEEKLFHSAAAKQWKKMGVRNHHGINIPLFSLITESSCGIGEFTDLYKLIDFCKSINFNIVQLLPLNDTSADPSPYNAISAFALNPIFIGIKALEFVEKISDYNEKIAILQKYNSSPRVKYDHIGELKKEFLREYYHTLQDEFVHRDEYQQFVTNNPWLQSYALFKAIKEKNGFLHWQNWPIHERSPSEESFKKLLEQNKEEIDFHIFLQYLCFEQLKKVKQYATERGILIKGDIPILINRDSADVWARRHLFFLKYSAGAPPDAFSADGQNWGFPVYDWEEVEKHGFQFWRQRLHSAQDFYHLYRIDHVVGFFRIWAIPEGNLPKDGEFIPRDEREWIIQGEKIMRCMLDATDLFPIAEDLGTVPPKVREVLRHLGIAGTKVMRWERNWHGDGSFIPPSEYIPESMTTVSTHDSDTLQLWWRHAPKESQLFCAFKGWDYRPFLSLDRHHEILKDSHTSASLFHINLLQEYLALFPELVSPNPMEERINIPGKILPTNWTYRLHVPLEKLMSHSSLHQTMKGLIS